ncbi:hypothetical protein Y032_0019g3924 [Ancylostoma ceylanicum]|uniref:Major facilitator superfamily (MFS) profile domain-containing protein n=1 Tax=Ancylostoma ceylanicum TaxID=53326 RepID=A0A016V1T7_9BILA|nr:hypothetical protein Y032_0019g3924 [Ancylostoma ceylanicum]
MRTASSKVAGIQLAFKKCTRTSVNAEPVILMLAISVGFAMTAQPLFMYWARCVEIVNTTKGYDVENASAICAHLSNDDNFDAINTVVQKDIASTRIYLQLTSGVLAMVAAPAIGTWSDRRGRKTPLLYTLSGFFIGIVFQLLATLTYEHICIYYWLFASELVVGLTGGMGYMFGVAITVVTDDSRNKLKPGTSTVPMRIGVASFLQSLGTLLGTLGTSMLAVQNPSSIDEPKYSYIKAALIQVSAGASAVIYTFFMVRETHFPHKDVYLYNRLEKQQSSPASPSNSAGIQVERTKSPLTWLRDNVSAIGEVLLQKRPGWTRCCLIMSLLLVMVEFLALDPSLLLLLLKRKPFSWSDKMFSYLSLLRGLLFSLGMVICPLIFMLFHCLGKDSLMIIIGIGASAVSYFMIAGAHTTEEIFLTTLFAIFCGAIGPAYRSFLPRMVPKDQTARLHTVCSLIMATCPMLSAAVFNSIYTASVEWWPGFAFFVGGILQVFVVIGQGCVHMLMRPQWLLEKSLKEQVMIHRLAVGSELSRNDGDIVLPSATVSDLPSGALEKQRRSSNPQ